MRHKVASVCCVLAAGALKKPSHVWFWIFRVSGVRNFYFYRFGRGIYITFMMGYSDMIGLQYWWLRLGTNMHGGNTCGALIRWLASPLLSSGIFFGAKRLKRFFISLVCLQYAFSIIIVILFMQSSGVVVVIVRILSSLTSIIFSLTRQKAERPLFYECFSSAHQGNADNSYDVSFFVLYYDLHTSSCGKFRHPIGCSGWDYRRWPLQKDLTYCSTTRVQRRRR